MRNTEESAQSGAHKEAQRTRRGRLRSPRCAPNKRRKDQASAEGKDAMEEEEDEEAYLHLRFGKTERRTTAMTCP